MRSLLFGLLRGGGVPSLVAFTFQRLGTVGVCCSLLRTLKHWQASVPDTPGNGVKRAFNHEQRAWSPATALLPRTTWARHGPYTSISSSVSRGGHGCPVSPLRGRPGSGVCDGREDPLTRQWHAVIIPAAQPRFQSYFEKMSPVAEVGGVSEEGLAHPSLSEPQLSSGNTRWPKSKACFTNLKGR